MTLKQPYLYISTAAVQVYKGRMPNGKNVAVKVMQMTPTCNVLKVFISEVETLCRAEHRNLVELLGCAAGDNNHLVLVYEYMPRGSLRDYLHHHSGIRPPPPVGLVQEQHLVNPPGYKGETVVKGSKCSVSSSQTLSHSDELELPLVGDECPPSENILPTLGWNKRMSVALDVAQGIKYLHVDCVPAIIHRDIKSSNILLDQDFTAKVGDFGLSKLLGKDNWDSEHQHASTTSAVRGSLGYVDPSYVTTGRVTLKSDVYSFGVLLIELLTGREPLDPTLLANEGKGLIRWALPHLENGCAELILDPSLKGMAPIGAVREAGIVAAACVQPQESERPSMEDVVEQLRPLVKWKDTSGLYTSSVSPPPVEESYISSVTIESSHGWSCSGSDSTLKKAPQPSIHSAVSEEYDHDDGWNSESETLVVKTSKEKLERMMMVLMTSTFDDNLMMMMIRSEKGRGWGKFTAKDVAVHNKRDDCWLIIDDKVYDVSSFVELHPGGDTILSNAGGNATAGFYGPQHPSHVFETVKDYCIGDLVAS
ncbi:hypothetical protein CBR_g141 [Chara braunii]|uniref:Protein kinase domain-containing protein n=1 Tax=Chara braunii TaxID=69332 RepID=A0A388JLU9_CHABU|nr:hypothetical protein CBR_g141 [Chara braunii]|eukprot:GBG58741.1 hypothetical protein CBR_g141 [Chara braunii]